MCEAFICQDEYDRIQADASDMFEEACSMYNAGHVSFARHLFLAIKKKFSKALHPYHHVLFNSLAYLLNAAMRESDFVSAKDHCEEIVDCMKNGPIPTDFPEIGDYQFRLGELYALLAGIAEAEEGRELLTGISSPKDLKSAAAFAFEECRRIRQNLLGSDHPKTMQVLKELQEVSE